MGKKFYAVRKGKQEGIFTTWEECRKQVHGFPGAIYKSFLTLEEAKAFLDPEAEGTAQSADVEAAETDTGVTVAYVDGSYHADSKRFSYGMVILEEGKELTFCEAYEDPELAAMRNVAGEIKGAEAAMAYALEHKRSKLVIYHDYEGIARWCLGDWKTNKEATKAYKAYYDQVKKSVTIQFQKVAGHSGDKYNDYADALAKQALGLTGR